MDWIRPLIWFWAFLSASFARFKCGHCLRCWYQKCTWCTFLTYHTASSSLRQTSPDRNPPHVTEALLLNGLCNGLQMSSSGTHKHWVTLHLQIHFVVCVSWLGCQIYVEVAKKNEKSHSFLLLSGVSKEIVYRNLRRKSCFKFDPHGKNKTLSAKHHGNARVVRYSYWLLSHVTWLPTPPSVLQFLRCHVIKASWAPAPRWVLWIILLESFYWEHWSVNK